jgi:hypothetical protein
LNDQIQAPLEFTWQIRQIHSSAIAGSKVSLVCQKTARVMTGLPH